MIKPDRLKKGDVIGVIAPACAVDRHSFNIAVKKLKGLGFKVKYSPSIFKKYRHFAGADKDRAKQINDMFADRTVKAIFCAKAGHGSFRLLPYLDRALIRRNPKIFIGYSDITILLCYLQKAANMVVFHGPVLCGEINQRMHQLTSEYLIRAITKPQPMGRLDFSQVRVMRVAKASGILTGGNISMLANSISTPYEIDTNNKILFLEDVKEDIQDIDNHFMQLKMAGKFDNIKGLIFGKMIGCAGCMAKGFNINSAISNVIGNKKIPMIYGFPSGHRKYGGANITLPFGVRVTLDTYERCLIIRESAVR